MQRLTLGPRALAAALGAVLAASAGPARAGTIFTDPYGVGSPDVLGSEANFDIHSLEIQTLTPTLLQMDLRLNYYGGDTTLSAFTVPGSSFAAVPVRIGDVLIQGHSYLWAIPLTGPTGGPGGIYGYSVGAPVPVGTPATRSDFLPGSLYRVSGTLDAAQVLGVDPADDFRGDVAVWGAIANIRPDFTGFVPVAYAVGGAEIGIPIQVLIGPGFYNDVSGGFQVHFASTTCACDVIDVTVPEPAPGALAAVAIALAATRARLCFPRRGGSRGDERG
jgi:hypothetical protein